MQAGVGSGKLPVLAADGELFTRPLASLRQCAAYRES